MIKTIIFDFGNVFINLDIEGAQKKAFETFQIETFSEEMLGFNSFYEQGLISTDEFLEFYSQNFPKLDIEDLKMVWNSILKDFPEHRLEFLKKLKSLAEYKLILLSNTNALHINWVKDHVPFYKDFKSCFDAFYLSHEINLAKPNHNIFEFVLSENKLKADECIFVDDNADNISTANTLGFQTWHLNPNHEDVVNLFEVKSALF